VLAGTGGGGGTRHPRAPPRPAPRGRRGVDGARPQARAPGTPRHHGRPRHPAGPARRGGGAGSGGPHRPDGGGRPGTTGLRRGPATLGVSGGSGRRRPTVSGRPGRAGSGAFSRKAEEGGDPEEGGDAERRQPTTTPRMSVPDPT